MNTCEYCEKSTGDSLMPIHEECALIWLRGWHARETADLTNFVNQGIHIGKKELHERLYNLLKLSEAARDFIWEPENWEAFQDLKKSISVDIPVNFMQIGYKVEKVYGGPPKEDE